MSEIQKVEIETKETPQPQPTLAETQLAMAVEYGQMRQAFQANQSELAEVKMQNQSMGSMLTEALAEMRALKSQTDTTSHRVETLNASQAAIISEVTDALENEENKDVIPVTPMETHIEIDQKPVNTKKSWLQRIMFS
jgi:chromosome segregation ATPase